MDDTVSKVATDQRALRNALSGFASGVTVVTYDNEGEPTGITVSSFTSVSLDPPLVLVNLRRESKAAHAIHDKPFAVNVLSEDQAPIAMQFAGSFNPDLEIKWDVSGIAPRLTQTHAFFIAKPRARYDGGDHVILVGEVVSFGYAPKAKPLLFHQSRFKELK